MKSKQLVFLVVLFIALASWLLGSETSPAQSVNPFDSPLLTPPAPPCPPPTPGPSEEAQKALEYISEREGIPVESLQVVYDREHTFPLIGRTFRDITILDERTHEGQEYALLIDRRRGFGR
jgi:hypothetical protein